MDLGIFSLSLSVKDLQASKAFYEKLGFKMIAGVEEENWIILKNGEAKIGLFQGMFDKNLLTFNPTDARSIQKHLKEQGVALIKEADADGTHPTHFTLVDPDDNPILFDQHVETPQ